MNIENVGDLVRRARAEAASKTEANPGSERDRLIRVAQEFESMLMLQMLKEMRKAGSWEDEEQSEGGLGAQTMFETIDIELAGHLAKAQGLGLGKQLMEAFQRMQPEGRKRLAGSWSLAPAKRSRPVGSPKARPALRDPRHRDHEQIWMANGSVSWRSEVSSRDRYPRRLWPGRSVSRCRTCRLLWHSRRLWTNGCGRACGRLPDAVRSSVNDAGRSRRRRPGGAGRRPGRE